MLGTPELVCRSKSQQCQAVGIQQQALGMGWWSPQGGELQRKTREQRARGRLGRHQGMEWQDLDVGSGKKAPEAGC